MKNLQDYKLNPRNPRFIKDEKYKKLLKSIKDFPEMLEIRPIIVDENNIILAGNMRFRALKELNYTQISDNWINMVKDLTEEQKEEFLVKDNLGFGEWDWDILANEFQEEKLLDWGFEEWEVGKQTDIDIDKFFENHEENNKNKIKTFICQHCGKESIK